jgi:hypothetical protein
VLRLPDRLIWGSCYFSDGDNCLAVAMQIFITYLSKAEVFSNKRIHVGELFKVPKAIRISSGLQTSSVGTLLTATGVAGRLAMVPLQISATTRVI